MALSGSVNIISIIKQHKYKNCVLISNFSVTLVHFILRKYFLLIYRISVPVNMML